MLEIGLAIRYSLSLGLGVASGCFLWQSLAVGWAIKIAIISSVRFNVLYFT